MTDEVKSLRAQLAAKDRELEALREAMDRGAGALVGIWEGEGTPTDMLNEYVKAVFTAAPADGQQAFHAFTCPQCGGHTWGSDSSAPKQVDWVVRCHNDGCSFTGMYDNHISLAAAPEEK